MVATAILAVPLFALAAVGLHGAGLCLLAVLGTIPAIDAAVGLGLHPSFEAAVAGMTRVAETIDPDPDRQRLYDQLYHRVYRRMYERLKPLYEEIMEITGYPPS